MDITSLSMSVYSGNINTGLELAMLSKVLDTAEESGEMIEQMIASVTGVGENIDIRA